MKKILVVLGAGFLMPLCVMGMNAGSIAQEGSCQMTFVDSQTIYAVLSQSGYRSLLDATNLHMVLGRATTTRSKFQHCVYEACTNYSLTHQPTQSNSQGTIQSLIGVLNNLTVAPVQYGSWREE